MQSNNQRTVYTYRRAASEEEGAPKKGGSESDEIEEDEVEDSDEAATTTTTAQPSSNADAITTGALDRLASQLARLPAACARRARDDPKGTVLVATAALAAAAAAAAAAALARRGRRGAAAAPPPPPATGQQRARRRSSAADGPAAADGPSTTAPRKRAAAPSPPPGPNANVKPTKDCVALPDGGAVVLRRRIAADNSCLFNAVGYTMHHSVNRAPFLRQVVSREVSSDPQEYSAAFLGMPNASYCDWIINPVNWGGGIELAILASHYRREIAAWNVETGQVHVFGEERGFTKQVMVIYNGVHYDALAVARRPRAPQDEDVTEFNPRGKRGRAIIETARRLVALNRAAAGFVSPTQLVKAVSGGALASAPAGGSAPAGAAGAAVVAALKCGDCAEVLAGAEAAKAHAAATGHVRFLEEAAPVAAAAAS